MRRTVVARTKLCNDGKSRDCVMARAPSRRQGVASVGENLFRYRQHYPERSSFRNPALLLCWLGRRDFERATPLPISGF